MFAVFKLSNGRSVQVDTDAVLAVEELENGSRIYVGGGSFDVKESISSILEELEEDEDEEDDED